MRVVIVTISTFEDFKNKNNEDYKLESIPVKASIWLDHVLLHYKLEDICLLLCLSSWKYGLAGYHSEHNY